MTEVEINNHNNWKIMIRIVWMAVGRPNNPKSVPPHVVVVHPRLAKLASPERLARLALRAVNSKEYYFFLKNPNFGLGFAGAAASAAVHSCNTAASHVI